MDQIDRFKLEALTNMQQTVDTLTTEVEKSKGYIARAEGQAQAQRQVSESSLTLPWSAPLVTGWALPAKDASSREPVKRLCDFPYSMDLASVSVSPQPAMAADAPEVSADGLTFTVTMREGILWSDGDDLLAEDFVLFYVAFDVTLVAMYFLIALWGGERRRYAALKFFIYTLVGSLPVLLGIIVLFLESEPQTFDMIRLAQEQPVAGAGADVVSCGGTGARTVSPASSASCARGAQASSKSRFAGAAVGLPDPVPVVLRAHAARRLRHLVGVPQNLPPHQVARPIADDRHQPASELLGTPALVQPLERLELAFDRMSLAHSTVRTGGSKP